MGALRLDCGCSPDGQECRRCNGFDADAGIAPPAPEPLLTTGLVIDDPWHNTALAATPPF